jgi:hypothetical protein
MGFWWNSFGVMEVSPETVFGTGSEKYGLTVYEAGYCAGIHLFSQKEGKACEALRNLQQGIKKVPVTFTPLDQQLECSPTTRLEMALCGNDLSMDDVEIFDHIGGAHGPVMTGRIPSTGTFSVLKSNFHPIEDIFKGPNMKYAPEV